MDYDDVYGIGRSITTVIIFIGCWIYSMFSFGFFLGLGLGWIPSIFIALIGGFLWPILAGILVLCIGFIVWAIYFV